MVLPTGQDRGGASEDVEVWRVTTGRRKGSESEEHLCPPQVHREQGSPRQPTRQALAPEASILPPIFPNQSLLAQSLHSHHTNLKISQ